jgi:hypothetical protein
VRAWPIEPFAALLCDAVSTEVTIPGQDPRSAMRPGTQPALSGGIVRV